VTIVEPEVAAAGRTGAVRDKSDERTVIIVALDAVEASLARQPTNPSGRTMTAPEDDTP